MEIKKYSEIKKELEIDKLISPNGSGLKPDDYHKRYTEMLKKYCVCCASLDDD